MFIEEKSFVFNFNGDFEHSNKAVGFRTRIQIESRSEKIERESLLKIFNFRAFC